MEMKNDVYEYKVPDEDDIYFVRILLGYDNIDDITSGLIITRNEEITG